MGKARLVTGAKVVPGAGVATGADVVTSAQVVTRAEVLAGRQGGLINRDQALAEGLTPRQVRTLLDHRRWQPATRGVYLTPVDSYRDEFDTTRARAAWMGILAVPGATATGLAALALHQIPGLPVRIPSEVCLPGGGSIAGPRGVTVRRYQSAIPARLLNGFPVAELVPALAQALCRLDLRHGVAVLDAALHQGRVTPSELEQVRHLIVGQRGARTARRALELADDRAESPLESWARVVFIESGLAPTTLQRAFYDSRGRLWARGDLAWQRADGTWVLVEMDGFEVHAAPGALYHDRSRQNRLMMDHTVTLLRFTGRDLHDGSAVATVRQALTL